MSQSHGHQRFGQVGFFKPVNKRHNLCGISLNFFDLDFFQAMSAGECMAAENHAVDDGKILAPYTDFWLALAETLGENTWRFLVS